MISIDTPMSTDPTPRSLVVKSNALVPLLTRLTLNELRLLAVCIAHIKRDSDTFDPITVHAESLSDLFGIDVDRLYGLVKDIATKINSKPLEIRDNKGPVVIYFFQSIRHNEGEGTFTFRFVDELKPFLLQLRDNFTAYRIKDVYQFKAASTWHIYEVLRQNKYKGKFSVDVEQFKALIDVSGKYSKFANLKYRLIDPAISEINAVSDIQVQYSLIKAGVTVEGLEFHIRENKTTHTAIDRARRKLQKSAPNKLPELAKLLREDFKVSTTNAKRIANLVHMTKSEDRVRDLLPKLKERWERTDQKRTLGAYVHASLRDALSQEVLLNHHGR